MRFIVYKMSAGKSCASKAARARSFCDCSIVRSAVCLAHGQMLATGSPAEIKNDKRVIDAYLGAQ